MIYFRTMLPFYTSRRHKKTKGFLAFSGGIKWEYRPEVGAIMRVFQSFIRRYRSSHRRCSIKKAILKNFPNSTESTFVGVSFSIKLLAFRLVLKRNSNTGVFYEHLFWRTSANDCFWHYPIVHVLKLGKYSRWCGCVFTPSTAAIVCTCTRWHGV